MATTTFLSDDSDDGDSGHTSPVQKPAGKGGNGFLSDSSNSGDDEINHARTPTNPNGGSNTKITRNNVLAPSSIYPVVSNATTDDADIEGRKPDTVTLVQRVDQLERTNEELCRQVTAWQTKAAGLDRHVAELQAQLEDSEHRWSQEQQTWKADWEAERDELESQLYEWWPMECEDRRSHMQRNLLEQICWAKDALTRHAAGLTKGSEHLVQEVGALEKLNADQGEELEQQQDQLLTLQSQLASARESVKTARHLEDENCRDAWVHEQQLLHETQHLRAECALYLSDSHLLEERISDASALEQSSIDQATARLVAASHEAEHLREQIALLEAAAANQEQVIQASTQSSSSTDMDNQAQDVQEPPAGSSRTSLSSSPPSTVKAVGDNEHYVGDFDVGETNMGAMNMGEPNVPHMGEPNVPHMGEPNVPHVGEPPSHEPQGAVEELSAKPIPASDASVQQVNVSNGKVYGHDQVVSLSRTSSETLSALHRQIKSHRALCRFDGDRDSGLLDAADSQLEFVQSLEKQTQRLEETNREWASLLLDRECSSQEWRAWLAAQFNSEQSGASIPEQLATDNAYTKRKMSAGNTLELQRIMQHLEDVRAHLRRIRCPVPARVPG